MLDFCRGRKAIDWKDNGGGGGGVGTKISVLTESDGFLVWCFKVMAKLNSTPGYIFGEL